MAVWHRPFGIFTLTGPNVRKDEWIFGPPTLLDIVPTVLTLFGLPIGADMDGKPLLEAFARPVEITTIPSWETVEGECGMHPPDRRHDPAASRALLQQFVALGYIEKPDANAERAAETAQRTGRYNLAQSLLDARRPAEALPILEELRAAEPAIVIWHWAGWRIAGASSKRLPKTRTRAPLPSVNNRRASFRKSICSWA